MIWLIEPSSSVRLERPSPSRRAFPWLTEFQNPSEAIRAAANAEPPSMIFLGGRDQGKLRATVAKLQAAVPGAQIITLQSWTKSGSIRSSLRRLILESSMPVSAEVDPPTNLYHISQREREVLRCMASGLIKKEIAEYLSLSYHTVDNYERRLFHKLKVHTRTAAVAKAVLEKLC